MATPYLHIPPDQRGYSISLANGSVSTQVEGGRNRYRRDFLGSSSIARVSWTVGNVERDFIVGFLEDLTSSGSVPFEIDLYAAASAGSPLQRYSVNLVPDTFSERSTSGLSHVLTANLEVIREAANDGLRSAQTLIFMASQGESLAYKNLMDVIINERLNF